MSIDKPDTRADQPPTPDNNVTLRMVAGMRRDMSELMEREARTIELMNRIALRMDEGFMRLSEEVGRVRRDLNDVRNDLILMENRVLTAITEVRNIAVRLDDEAAVREHA